MKRGYVKAGRAIVALVLLVGGVSRALGEEVWSARNGTTTLSLYHESLGELGLTVSAELEQASPQMPFTQEVLEVDGRTDLTFTVKDGSVVEVFGNWLHLAEGLTLVVGDAEWTVSALGFASETLVAPRAAEPGAATHCGVGCVQLDGLKVGFNPRDQKFTIYARELSISPALAETLGAPELAGTVLGSAHMILDAQWTGGDEPRPVDALDGDGPAEGGVGPDVTLCQVYNLRQFGRVGGVVGLSSAGTSWNVGDVRLDWFGSPNPRHPFIVYNVFRIKDDRFEQIGQSWIKHGWCALDNTQCGGSCQGTGCSTLNVNCTDTYSSSLNASQSGLGPRDEVNPWTGTWTYAGSHFAAGAQSHNQIQHRIAVKDADLDPAQNAGATYYFDQIYICYDDVDVMNSSGWKPATPVGAPGGMWQFTQSGSGTMPTSGFAYDAWDGARQTLLAQEIPVVEFESPDGRCVLSAKATDLGGGTWHYEYALFNIDMDRKVNSFRIPIPAGTNVTNVGFHAVESMDEPYSNTPWTPVVGDNSVTWSTSDNPVRWGTSYAYRFDADVPPGDVTVTLGMYEPGTPATVAGTTTGPFRAGPAIVHGSDGVSFSNWAFTGFIDAAMESDDGQNVNLGLNEFTIQFSEAVQNIGGGPLSADAFVVRETGGAAPPNVTGFTALHDQEVTLTLDRNITLTEWTTIEAHVQNTSGVAIENLGDLGPGVAEPDRIDIGYLPCDINQDGTVSPFDLLTFRQITVDLFDHDSGVDGDYIDTDRDGSVSPFDLLAFRQLINGVSPPATQSWNSASMGSARP